MARRRPARPCASAKRSARSNEAAQPHGRVMMRHSSIKRMSILDILLGKPLATSDERGEQVGVSAGIPIFGLDALSSAAYGPEAALTLLIPLGLAGVAHIVPISASIIV